MPDSSISKFFEKSRKERLNTIATFANLSKDELDILENTNGGISFDQADKMIENAIGTFSLPLGVATNFKINGKDYVVPMVIEEPSVIAAASKGAKIARIKGGFEVTADESYSIGQIQILDVDANLAIKKIQDFTSKILELANSKSNTLSKMNKGAKEISCKIIDTPSGNMLIVELLIDVGDAMGANTVNTMAETISPLIEKITDGRVRLRILSNLADKRLAKASVKIPLSKLGYRHFSGEEVANGIVEACALAEVDPYRAATHNKGIMNGIDSVILATGNDWRAIEAGAHAWAASDGRYSSDKQGHSFLYSIV